VVLETNNQEQLIFKHAISTVAMGRALHGHGERPAAVPVAGAPSPKAASPEESQGASASATEG